MKNYAEIIKTNLELKGFVLEIPDESSFNKLVLKYLNQGITLKAIENDITSGLELRKKLGFSLEDVKIITKCEIPPKPEKRNWKRPYKYHK